MSKNFYKTLGLKCNATQADIKNAYRARAKKIHPDVNPDNPEATEEFKKINEAYTVLRKTETRIRYDQKVRKPRTNKVYWKSYRFNITPFINDNIAKKKKIKAFPWADLSRVGWSNLEKTLWPLSPATGDQENGHG